MSYEGVWGEGKGREMGSSFLVGLCGFSRVYAGLVSIFGGASVRVFGGKGGAAPMEAGRVKWVGHARGGGGLVRSRRAVS